MSSTVSEPKPLRRNIVHRFRDEAEEEVNSDELQVAEEDTEPTQSEFEEFEAMYHLMTDQRTSTREKAIRDTILYLQRRFTPASLEDCYETVIQNLVWCIKRGQAPEIKLALQCLCLVLATLQEVPENLRASIFDNLSTIAIDPLITDVRPDIISVLAFVALLSGDAYRQSEVQKLMLGLIESSIEGNDEILLAAVRGWGLLATQLSHNQLLSSGFPLLPTFSQLLRHDNFEVRAVAGENIALLYEARWAAKTMGSATETPGWQDLLQQLKALASENNRYISRQTRVEQRALFRAYCQTVETGVVPPVTFNIRRERVVLESWRQIKQYDYCTMLLEGGMAAQLLHNGWMRSALGLESTPEAIQGTSVPGMEKTGKQRYLERSKDRGKKLMQVTGGRYFVEPPKASRNSEVM